MILDWESLHLVHDLHHVVSPVLHGFLQESHAIEVSGDDGDRSENKPNANNLKKHRESLPLFYAADEPLVEIRFARYTYYQYE